jgi:hypothetical protein
MSLDSNKKIGELFEIAQMVSLFVILIGLFFGSMFAFDSYFLSIPVSFGLVIALYKLIQILIDKRMERNRGSSNMGINVLWLLFVVVAIPTNILILHMFNVEFFEKQEIQNVGIKKIDCLDSLHTSYTNSYNGYCIGQKNNLITKLKFKDFDSTLKIVNQEQFKSILLIQEAERENYIDTNIIKPWRQKFELKDSFIFGSNFPQYLIEQRDNINQFKHFKQNKTLNDINLKLQQTRDSIIPFLQNEIGINLSFNNVCIDENSLINSPLILTRKQFGVFTLLIVILTNGLLLLPYFLSPKKVFHNTAGHNDVKTFE